MTTNTDIKKWRMRQIAATILYRICGNVRVEAVPENSVYDLLVTELGDNVCYGVKVASSSFLDTLGYRMYLEGMEQFHHPSRKKFKPIILMCVNEVQETAQIGIQYAWMYNHGITIKKVRLHQATDKIWPRFRDNINAMFDTIRSIAIDDYYIVRSISFEMRDYQRHLMFANAIYLRKMTESYKVSRRDPETDKERLETMLQVIRQDEYPSDSLDTVIEEAIGREFENVNIQKSMLLFTPDIAQLQQDTNKRMLPVNVLIHPHFAVGVMPPFGNISLPSVTIHIYSTEQRALDYVNSKSLYSEHDMEEFIPYCMEVEEMKKTLAQPEDILVI